MSPQIIVCDEIATPDDTAAILEAAEAGIPVAASAHAGGGEELLRQTHLRPLISSTAFGAYVGLLGQTLGGYRYDIYRCGEGVSVNVKR